MIWVNNCIILSKSDLPSRTKLSVVTIIKGVSLEYRSVGLNLILAIILVWLVHQDILSSSRVQRFIHYGVVRLSLHLSFKDIRLFLFNINSLILITDLFIFNYDRVCDVVCLVNHRMIIKVACFMN
jgi:hypothetical protein